MKCENFSFPHHFFLEKVCGFEKKSYLCIRFRLKKGVSAEEKRSLKDLHKTEEVVVQEARGRSLLGN